MVRAVSLWFVCCVLHAMAWGRCARVKYAQFLSSTAISFIKGLLTRDVVRLALRLRAYARSLAAGSAVCVFVCAAAARSASAEAFGLPAFAFARLWRQSQRLGCGKKGIDELKAHAFFKSVAPCRFLPSIFLIL